MASGIYIDYSRYYSLSQILPASHALKYIYLSNFNAIKRIIAIRQFIKVHELEEKSKIIIINIHNIVSTYCSMTRVSGCGPRAAGLAFKGGWGASTS